MLDKVTLQCAKFTCDLCGNSKHEAVTWEREHESKERYSSKPNGWARRYVSGQCKYLCPECVRDTGAVVESRNEDD